MDEGQLTSSFLRWRLHKTGDVFEEQRELLASRQGNGGGELMGWFLEKYGKRDSGDIEEEMKEINRIQKDMFKKSQTDLDSGREHAEFISQTFSQGFPQHQVLSTLAEATETFESSFRQTLNKQKTT